VDKIPDDDKLKELKAGIIGMGKMGLLHAAILNSIKNVRVDSVADPEKLIINFIKKNSPDIKVYDNYKTMLEKSELDFVFITTPVNSHIEIASNCIDRNLPFFVEKPLSRTAKECEPLFELLRNKPVVNMVGYCLRYSETFSKTKELLNENILGEIKNVKCSVYQTLEAKRRSGWRFKKDVSGGGILIDLGAHLIDLLIWFFGNIKTINGKTEFQNTKNVEDFASASLGFENGINCSFEASWNVDNYRLPETTIEVNGTKGKLKVNENFLKISYFNENEKDSILYKQNLYTGVEIDIAGPEYTREDLDFIDSIKNQQQMNLNVVNSSKVQSVIDSIYLSSNSKKQERPVYVE